MIQKRVFIVVFAVFGWLNTVYAVQDSLTAYAETPDTLLDLNRSLGGLKELVIARETIIPQAVAVTPEGLIILRTPSALKAESYAFELKAVASNEEVYLVSIKISRKGNMVLVSTVSDKIDMATGFRKEGKIYVVVAVSLILFCVLIGYLIFLDRRQRKIDEVLANRDHK
jgi:hypothetical protein